MLRSANYLYNTYLWYCQKSKITPGIYIIYSTKLLRLNCPIPPPPEPVNHIGFTAGIMLAVSPIFLYNVHVPYGTWHVVHGNTGERMHYTYVLISLKDRKLYIGYTQDLERRLQEHKLGKVPSTKSRLPLKPLYFEGHFAKEDAIRREDYFKTSKGKSTLQQMLRTSLQDPEKLPDKWGLNQNS